MALSPLAVGSARFRVGPWHQSPDIAYVIPLTTAVTFGGGVLPRLRERIGAMGFSRLYTAAVGPAERDALAHDAFTVREELHLLRHDLRSPLPEPPSRWGSPRLRRGRRRDHPAVLGIDSQAFNSFWQLDEEGLQEALDATPISRFRVTDDGARSGYAITGRAGIHGYLQRLAVAPDNQRRGLGTALIADSLHWLRRRNVNSVLVNTQLGNARALELYERVGFRRESDRLAVLERELA